MKTRMNAAIEESNEMKINMENVVSLHEDKKVKVFTDSLFAQWDKKMWDVKKNVRQTGSEMTWDVKKNVRRTGSEIRHPNHEGNKARDQEILREGAIQRVGIWVPKMGEPFLTCHQYGSTRKQVPVAWRFEV